jgi:hypothetical protein
MSKATRAVEKRIRLAVNHLQEAGIDDCLIVFEGRDSQDKVRPFVIRMGSPSACLEFAQFSAEYLQNERDCTVYGIDEPDEDDHGD